MERDHTMERPPASHPDEPGAVDIAPAAADAAPGTGEAPAVPFWREKTLAAMSREEWESLCDGCGRCCLVKLEDEDDGSVHYTDVGCRLLDLATCRCRNYPGRAVEVPDCIALTPAAVATLSWLPPTCAYRLVGEGRDLPAWHPLVSGDPGSVHEAGVSVRGRATFTEDEVFHDALPGHVVTWPRRVPRAARQPVRGPVRGPSGTPVRRPR